MIQQVNMMKFGLELEQKSKELMVEKNFFYEKDYSRIKADTDDDLPLNKAPKFPTLTIIVRAVFQEGKKLYPQIYLDECLCEL